MNTSTKLAVSVVITDLDNTLYDWVDVWHRSFRAMLDRLFLDSGVALETLIQDFKAIHEKHGTSEYAFVVEELPSLKAKYPDEDLVVKFDEAIRSYRAARKDALQLYPSVAETLETLKDKGCLLVAYTESMSFYTNFRVKKLGLDRILDYVYSPPDHELPNGKTTKELRFYPEEHYSLRRAVSRNIPKGELKPNPKLLLDILRDVGAEPSEAIYVGDSLMKDVLMAQKANVTGVWAKYGAAQHREEYELLRKVTHWTLKDVQREKELKPEHVNPSHTLESGLNEMLDMFEFKRFHDVSPSHLTLAVDMWKKTVDVQQHFNDLELRIRNYAVTILAAMLSLAALSMKEDLQFKVFNHTTSVAAVTLFAAIFPWLAFYFMDRFWYHRLLYGAVDHGRTIENRWKGVFPEIVLTDSIGKSSPSNIFGLVLRSPRKMDIFYLLVAALIFALSVVTHVAVHPRTLQLPTSIVSNGQPNPVLVPEERGEATSDVDRAHTSGRTAAHPTKP